MGKLEGVAWACVLAGLLGWSAVLAGCDGYEIETVGSIDGLGFDTRATASADAGPASDLGPRGAAVDDYDDASTGGSGSASSSSQQDAGSQSSTPTTPSTPSTPQPKTSYELAQHWAPVWYQDTDDRHYTADYFTRYDYDGNTRGDDNWEHLDSSSADLRATVYYAHVETNTHHFLLYANFHPRDWDKDCSPLLPFSEPCHENDMEGAMVVLRKVSYLPYGRFEVLYTEAHNTLHIYTNNTTIKKGSSSSFESTVRVTFEGGSHPELYVESKGHGVCALYHDGDKHCKHAITKPFDFPGGDGVVYRYKGLAEAPTSGNDRDVGYSLRSLQYSLWLRRADICDGGCTFDKAMTYAGLTLGTAFDGDSYGKDKANPPWAWDDPSDGPVYRGDFFFRPAKALASHLVMTQPISQTYLVNPFLPKSYW